MAAPAFPLDLQFQLLDLKQPPRPTLVPDLPPVEEVQRAALKELRGSLEAHIAARITSGLELARSISRRTESGIIPLTIASLDALVNGGLPRGRMLEFTARSNSAGRFSSVLAALASTTSMGEAAALVDLGDHFEPRTAEADGIDLRRLLWVRPRNLKHAVHAAEMLVSTGFSLVVLEAGVPPVRGRVPDASWIRLARAAEQRGCALLISSPYPISGTAAEGVVVMERTSTMWIGATPSTRVLRGVTTPVRLERHRTIRPGRHASISFTTIESITGSAFPASRKQ